MMPQESTHHLRSMIEDPSFDEKAWKSMFLNIKTYYSIPDAPEVFQLLLRSPVADLGTLDEYSHLLFKYKEARQWLGENPMMPLWIEAESHGDAFPYIAKRAMCYTLTDWAGVELRLIPIDKTLLRSLFDLIKDRTWSFVFQSPTGEERDSFYDDFVRDYIYGETLALCQSLNDMDEFERAKLAHRLLVALCRTCNVPVPGNIFSCLEEP